MTGTFTLYSYPGNKNSCKALITAQFANVDVQVDPDFQMGVTNKTPDYIAKIHPLGQVPGMTTPDGTGVFESNTLARCVAR